MWRRGGGWRDGSWYRSPLYIQTMPLFPLLNRLIVLSFLPCLLLCCTCVCVWVRAYLQYLHTRALHSHRSLPSSDPSGTTHHHRPNARPASQPAQPCPGHHADPHAFNPSDPELCPRARRQSTPSAGAARAGIRNHLHTLWLSLHTHTLHIGISHWLNWSTRYENSNIFTFIHSQWMYCGNWILSSNQSCSPCKCAKTQKKSNLSEK